MKNLIFILIGFLFWGCQPESEELASSDYKIVMTGHVAFPLDSMTGSDFASMNTFAYKGKDYLSTLNIACGCINVYDYNTQNLVKKIILEKDGPNGVGQMNFEMFAHFMPNLDTFYILNGWTNSLLMFSENNKILKKIHIPKEEFTPMAVFYSSTTNPIKQIGNDLYIPMSPYGESLDFTEIPTVLKINLTNENKTKLFYFPDTYKANFFGFTPFKYRSNFVKLPNSDKTVVSFSTDDNVYELINNKITNKKKSLSKFFKKINSFSSNKTDTKKLFNSYNNEDQNLDKIIADDREYAMTTNDFSWIVYDEKSKLYIRQCYLRPSRDQYLDGARRPNFSLIILDEELKTVGETFFAGGLYRPSSYFLNQHGLHIFSEDKTSRNEDKVVFTMFKITK